MRKLAMLRVRNTYNTGLYITANNSYRSKVSSCNSCKI